MLELLHVPFKPRNKIPFAYPGINFKTNLHEGMEWPITGSRGTIYTVKMTARGFTCDCDGFQFYGRCKHINSVGSNMVRY